MATTVVGKGAGRPAAAARRRKHDQRTPLPPRPGVVEDAREAQAALVDTAQSDTRSHSKAQAFAEKAVAAKWDVSLDASPHGVELTATRGAETLVQAWSNGVWQYPASFYAFGDRTTKPRNASGASKLLVRTPEEAGAEASKVASNKHFRKSEPKDIATKMADAKRSLPFDPGLDTDEVVLTALTGQALVWYNRLSRGTESAMVSRKGARMSITPSGERVVTFCCPATGYRSCLVTAILKVGRGRRSTTKGQDVETVEVD